MGLGGSYRYNPNGKNMYTEREMKLRALRLRPKAMLKGGVDVLVTHSPAKGYGDLEDLPHRGFDTFTSPPNSSRRSPRPSTPSTPSRSTADA